MNIAEKMLFLDLDGTIIGHINALRPQMEKALIDAREKGLKIAICTGRTNRGLSKEVEQVLAPEGPHIFESGAAVVYPSGEIIKSWPMTQAVAASIADVAMSLAGSYDIAAEFYTGDKVFVSKKTDDAIRHAKALKIDPDFVIEADVREVAKDYEVVRVQWVGQPDAMEIALQENPKETSVGVASAHACPGALFASVTAAGVDKGTAVKYVAEELFGLDLQNCYAAGDSHGDVPMLKVVGHPFIMDNAKDELKAIYNVVPSVEDDGVITILNEALS